MEIKIKVRYKSNELLFLFNRLIFISVSKKIDEYVDKNSSDIVTRPR